MLSSRRLFPSVGVTCYTNTISAKHTANSPSTPMIIIYLVIPGTDNFILTVLTMGLRSAAMACRRSTSAVSWILKRRGLSTFNYLDDFIGVSPLPLATSHFNKVGILLHHLGLEESLNKSCPPSPVRTCLGVQLNTLDFTLSVDSDRLAEIESLLQTWLHKRTTTKSSLQSLVGKLVFVSKCVRQSRVFIARILCFLRSVKFNHHQF